MSQHNSDSDFDDTKSVVVVPLDDYERQLKLLRRENQVLKNKLVEIQDSLLARDLHQQETQQIKPQEHQRMQTKIKDEMKKLQQTFEEKLQQMHKQYEQSLQASRQLKVSSRPPKTTRRKTKVKKTTPTTDQTRRDLDNDIDTDTDVDTDTDTDTDTDADADVDTQSTNSSYEIPPVTPALSVLSHTSTGTVRSHFSRQIKNFNTQKTAPKTKKMPDDLFFPVELNTPQRSTKKSRV